MPSFIPAPRSRSQYCSIDQLFNKLPTDFCPPQVSWDGPEDAANPYNWPNRRKIIVGIVCSASQLVTTMSASMIAPALDQILVDLNMAASTGQIAFSVFFLGLGFGPFLVAPLAETYGRKPVWIAGNLVYILWNSLCPVGNSSAMMIVGRLLAASGCSVGVTVCDYFSHGELQYRCQSNRTRLLTISFCT